MIFSPFLRGVWPEGNIVQGITLAHISGKTGWPLTATVQPSCTGVQQHVYHEHTHICFLTTVQLHCCAIRFRGLLCRRTRQRFTFVCLKIMKFQTGAFNIEAEQARCQMTAVKLHQQLAPRYFERILNILFLASRDDSRRYFCDICHCVCMSLF